MTEESPWADPNHDVMADIREVLKQAEASYSSVLRAVDVLIPDENGIWQPAVSYVYEDELPMRRMVWEYAPPQTTPGTFVTPTPFIPFISEEEGKSEPEAEELSYYQSLFRKDHNDDNDSGTNERGPRLPRDGRHLSRPKRRDRYR